MLAETTNFDYNYRESTLKVSFNTGWHGKGDEIPVKNWFVNDLPKETCKVMNPALYETIESEIKDRVAILHLAEVQELKQEEMNREAGRLELENRITALGITGVKITAKDKNHAIVESVWPNVKYQRNCYVEYDNHVHDGYKSVLTDRPWVMHNTQLCKTRYSTLEKAINAAVSHLSDMYDRYTTENAKVEDNRNLAAELKAVAENMGYRFSQETEYIRDYKGRPGKEYTVNSIKTNTNNGGLLSAQIKKTKDGIELHGLHFSGCLNTRKLQKIVEILNQEN